MEYFATFLYLFPPGDSQLKIRYDAAHAQHSRSVAAPVCRRKAALSCASVCGALQELAGISCLLEVLQERNRRTNSSRVDGSAP